MKRRLPIVIIAALLLLLMPQYAGAENDALTIDTEGVYPGMSQSYSNGYIPKVENGAAILVLPLKGGDTLNSSVIVTPVFGSEENSPFIYGNYEFIVSPDENGVYLIHLALPLKSERVNGRYLVQYFVRYTDIDGTAGIQEFPVYFTVTDGRDPNYTEPPPTVAPTPTPPIVNQLYIISDYLFDGMDKTYAEGYIPSVINEKLILMLPLKGTTYDGHVQLSASLGETKDSPFVYGNYSQSARGDNTFLFRFEIPLSADRFNGTYSIELVAEYLDVAGKLAKQTFTVHINITDGLDPPNPNEVEEEPKEEVEKPDLFISSCELLPESINGNEVFAVNVTVKNIGNIYARGIRLSYGSEENTVIPLDVTGAVLLKDQAAGAEQSVTFQMRSAKDAIAGSHPFNITIDYGDLYGGAYTTTRTFLVNIMQPASMTYDPIIIPKTVTAGDTIELLVNVFNTGKSALRNVTVNFQGEALVPLSSVYFGDIAAGGTGNSSLSVFVGMLQDASGDGTGYGKTSGSYTITYQDDNGETHSEERIVNTEIIAPKSEETSADAEVVKEPVLQWWISILVGLAVIAIIVAIIVTSRFIRRMLIR